MVGARVRRQQVAYAVGRGRSSRRACALLSVARSTLVYQSRLAAKDTPVLTTMRDLADQYPRYGYRRIRIFLQRAGHAMSADRAHRLWRQAALQVPRRRPRRRAAVSRPRPLPSTMRNYVWAYNFGFDTCATGRTLKCLTIIDEWTRECLATDGRGRDSFGPRDRGADTARECPRRAALSAIRQWPGVRRLRDPALADGRGNRDGADRLIPKRRRRVPHTSGQGHSGYTSAARRMWPWPWRERAPRASHANGARRRSGARESV